MEYYRQNFSSSGANYGTVNTFNAINIPYGDCLLPSNSLNRQGAPGPGIFGNGKDYPGCIGQVIQPLSVIGPQNTQSVKDMNNHFLNTKQNPEGVPQIYNFTDNFSNVDVQQPRPETYNRSQNQIYSNNNGGITASSGSKPVSDYYVSLASESLHQKADILMKLFFSDSNINHLRNTVVKKVKEITADSGVAGDKEGVTIQTPNMEDFFYYMVNIFQNYKIHNGSICFVNLKNNSDVKSDIAKLNTNVLQEYVSKMISQINMYIYYYKDASQIPDQLSQPVYTSMKGSRSLEYNTGFVSGNSMGVASYNQVGNII